MVLQNLTVPSVSGKTLSYAVPLVQRLQASEPKVSRSDGPLALVVVPTREVGSAFSAGSGDPIGPLTDLCSVPARPADLQHLPEAAQGTRTRTQLLDQNQNPVTAKKQHWILICCRQGSSGSGSGSYVR